MEFFDKLGKKASEAYKVTADKTGKLAKEAKLRMKMGELKSEINDIYKDIGKVIYENYVREEKQNISNNIEEKCTETSLKEILQLKDKKQCPNCYVEIEKDVKFCPECGTKQEITEEQVKEVEIVNQQEDNKEDNNQNNDKQEQDNSEQKSDLEKTIEVESDVKLEDDITVEHFEVEDEE